ncbi:MAG TPA: hypothetical protein VM889_10765 [Candidatus Thermoplasmatota archaeon]|nr:hypothetical protein [Candidatus Thermoplasmatota archaeon]
MPRRRASPDPAQEGAGVLFTVEQPSLFWPAYQIVREERLLGRVTRVGWRRFAYEDSEAKLKGRFERGRLAFADAAGRAWLEARAAGVDGLWPLDGLHLARPDPPDRPHARLLAKPDPDAAAVAVFGAMRGTGLAGAQDVWVAEALAEDERRATRLLALATAVLRYRPARF